MYIGCFPIAHCLDGRYRTKRTYIAIPSNFLCPYLSVHTKSEEHILQYPASYIFPITLKLFYVSGLSEKVRITYIATGGPNFLFSPITLKLFFLNVLDLYDKESAFLKTIFKLLPDSYQI